MKLFSVTSHKADNWKASIFYHTLVSAAIPCYMMGKGFIIPLPPPVYSPANNNLTVSGRFQEFLFIFSFTNPPPPQWCRCISEHPMIGSDRGLISSLLIHCEVIFKLFPDGCQFYAASKTIFPSRGRWFRHVGGRVHVEALYVAVSCAVSLWPKWQMKIYVSDRYLSRSADKRP